MDSWINGSKGSVVKRVIDNNFDVLDRRTMQIKNDVSSVVISFASSDWIFNDDLKTYTFSISLADYNKDNPCVDAYIKNDIGYSFVYGGYRIGEFGIILQSDMPYEGRVVIR